MFRWLVILLFVSGAVRAQDRLYPIAKNGKWGLVRADQSYVLQPTYDYLEYIPSAYKYIYYQNNKKGLISRDGQVISQPIYTDIVLFDTVYSSFKNDKGWNLMKEDQQLLSNELDSINMIGTNLFKIEEDDRYRLYQSELEQISEKSYRTVQNLGNGSLCKSDKGTYDLYNNSDLTFLGTNYHSLSSASSNYYIAAGTEQSDLFQIDSICKKLTTGSSMVYLKKDWFLMSEDAQLKLFLAEQLKSYTVPELDDIIRIQENRMTYSLNGLVGMWDLDQEKSILEPIYDGISESNGVLYLYSDGNYGLARLNGKIKLTPEYSSISNYDNFYVVRKSDKYGLTSVGGSVLESCIYDEIRVYDNKVKCLNSDVLVVVDFDESGSIKEKHSFDEFMSVMIGKQRFPNQKVEDMTFSGPAASREDRIGYKYGWFRPELQRKFKDTIKTVLGNWGMRDKEDSIHIRPKYRDIEIFEDLGMTKAYSRKRYHGGPYGSNVTPVQLTSNLIGQFNPDFVLVDHDSMKVIGRNRFLFANFADFKNYSLCRAMSRSLCLLDKSGDIVYDSLTWFGQWEENTLRICRGGSISSSSVYSSTGEYTYQFIDRIGGLNREIKPDHSFIEVNQANWYFLDKSGRQMNEEPFQYAFAFTGGMSIVKQNGKWGVIDTAMNEIIPIIYDRVETVQKLEDERWKRYYKVSQNTGQKYLYHKISGELEETDLYKIEYYSDGHWFRKESRDGRWALVDTNLNFITPYSFDHVSPYVDGYSTVVTRGKRSIIDNQGQAALPYYKAKKINYLGHGRYAIIQRKGTMVVNTRGDTIIDAADCKDVLSTSEEYIVYVNRSKQTTITNDAHSIKLPKNSKLISYDLNERQILVERNNKSQVFDLGGKVINKNMIGAQKIGSSSVVVQDRNRRMGILSLSGDTLIKTDYKSIEPLHNGWTFAKYSKRYRIIDQHGELKDSIEVFRFVPFGNHYLVTTRTGIGLLSDKAEWLIEPSYGKIEQYNGQFLRAWDKGRKKVRIFDLNGKPLIDDAFEDIKGISASGFIVTFNRQDYLYNGYLNKAISFQDIQPVSSDIYILYEWNQWGVFDEKGTEVIPVKYHRIEVDDADFKVRYFNSFGYYTSDGSVIYDPN